MELKSKNDHVIEVVAKLFVYTDQRAWQKLLEEVFKEELLFDMSSLGGGPAQKLKACDICEMWSKGFEGIDHVYHHSGNYIVKFNSEIEPVEAEVFCYAKATHFKSSATKGNTRDFIGDYNIHLSFTDQGWRIDKFRYNLKFTLGNQTLE